MSGMEQAGTGNVLLSLIVWTPMIGAFLLLLIPREQADGAKRAAFVFSSIAFLLSLALWASTSSSTGGSRIGVSST
jgi:NADH:ubiquinone oxidoreductase subunit 4 (subunit M)